jgi:hypothetical protein
VELERSFVHRALAGAYHALLEHTARLWHAAGDVRGARALLTDLLTRDQCNEPAAPCSSRGQHPHQKYYCPCAVRRCTLP